MFVFRALDNVMLGFLLNFTSGTKERRSMFLSMDQMIKRKDTIGKFANGG